MQKERARIKNEQMGLMPWIDSIMEFRGANELTRKAVIMMVDYVYVHKDKHIEVRFRHHDEIQDLLNATKGGDVA